MHIQVFFERATTSFEVLGVLSMVLGFVLAFALALVTLKRTADGARDDRAHPDGAEYHHRDRSRRRRAMAKGADQRRADTGADRARIRSNRTRHRREPLGCG